jgi:hypothetical protein
MKWLMNGSPLHQYFGVWLKQKSIRRTGKWAYRRSEWVFMAGVSGKRDAAIIGTADQASPPT